MPSPVRPFRKTVLMISWLLFLALAVAATAQTRNRITRSMADGESVAVAGAPAWARAQFDRGRVNGGMRINRAAMVFRLASAQQADLEKLLEEQQDPDSPNYHKWLTPEDYAARFGVSEGDLARVASWLQSQGLTVDGYSRARTRVFFSGTAAQVENAFRTEIHQYLVNGEARFANATQISVPAALSGMVLGFRGLDNFRPQPRARLVARPNLTSHISGNHFVAPGDFATIYNLTPLYAAGLDGTGQKIAVVGQTEIDVSDIDAFRSAAGLPATNLQLVPVPGSGSGSSSGDEVEADLDIEWSGAVAKNATILYVFTGANSTTMNVFDALEYAIDQNLAPVISTSYGNCEANLGTFTQTLRQDAQEANTHGQTITAASGDSGAADCDAHVQSAIKGLAVDSPASVPEVTAIGGSEFTGDLAGVVAGNPPSAAATPFWGASNGTSDNINSALSYIPETSWNDTTLSISGTPPGPLSASGGGASKVFTKIQAPWQNALTPADGHRDVPDVTLMASPFHDATLICSAGACVNGFRDSSTNFDTVGGTSVGAPAFAGIVAILNQATASNGQGNINPTLYALAVSHPTAFHDITTGNNIVPCTSGSTGCPASAPFQIGFTAGTGYDLVTGLGSINANVLVTLWPGFVGTPGFSVGGAPVRVAAPGLSGTATTTVSMLNGFSGTVALTCSNLPAGASCAFAPSSFTTSGTSTMTITTTSATPVGTSNVTVTGTSGATTHNASVSLTVSAPNFTMAAPVLAPATVTAGGSATSSITIAPTGGFTGTVALVCTVTGGGTPAPKCALSSNSVASASGTSTLTVSTTASHNLSGALRPASPGDGFGWLTAGSSAFLAGIFVVGGPTRRRRRAAGLGLMLLVFFAAGVGCGGGSSSPTKAAGTPAGNYTVTVTATSGTLTQSKALSLTVQ